MTLSEPLKRAFYFLLLAAYGVFLCSYFIFRDYSDPYRFFARVVFVLGFFVLAGSFRELGKQPLFQLLLLYMFYLVCSGFWSTPFDWYQTGQKFTISLYLLSFFAITHFLLHWDEAWYQRMLRLCVLLAALSALVSLLVFYRENPFPDTRLDGIGSLTNVNEFANIYGLFALLAMGFALHTRQLAHKAPYLIAVVAFVCFVWFGQSRTAFASLLLALLVLMGLTLRRGGMLYTTFLAVMAGALVLAFPDLPLQALHRGIGLRPEIWAQMWAEAKASPILGHGLTSLGSIDAGEQHFGSAHNAYLQVFWQGGVIGLCLFLAVLAVAFRQAWLRGRQRGDYTVFCILVFTSCIMMTGVDTLIARPRDQWLVFWLPLAMLLSYPHRAPQSRLS